MADYLERNRFYLANLHDFLERLIIGLSSQFGRPEMLFENKLNRATD